MDPPLPDELEITLLGRGVGECVVVHLLNDEWMVVDCFTGYRTDRVPAALAYLREMKVSPKSVKAVVVTHFHVDHYRGVGRLHDDCVEARLMVTEALRHDQFQALYLDDAEPPILGDLAGATRRARARRIGGHTPGLRHLKAGTDVFVGHGVVVKALSPTDAAALQSNVELGQAMATDDRTVTASRLRDDNRCSIVLHITAPGGIAALLGADLLRNPPEFGWQAVLDEPNHDGLLPASLVKVPHHGSDNADFPLLWNTLVAEAPELAVAPFWPRALPDSDADIPRLCSRAGRLWQAAPSIRWKDDEFGNRVSVPPLTGVVQARRRLDEAGWRVETRYPAFEVTCD